jgi:hypothetical protein
VASSIIRRRECRSISKRQRLSFLYSRPETFRDVPNDPATLYSSALSSDDKLFCLSSACASNTLRSSAAIDVPGSKLAVLAINTCGISGGSRSGHIKDASR